MSAIPYTVEGRPDTGVNNVKLGLWLFLASEAMLFGGLFSAYFMLRAGAAEPWRPFGSHLGLASIDTIVLLATGVALTFAVRAARARDVRMFRGWMFGSVCFAYAFCAFKLSEYADLFGQHLRPSTSTQLAVYFLLTGVHLLHVVGGILVITWLGLTRAGRWTGSAPLVVNRVEAAALYWYFVDLVWLVLFVLLYVV